MKSNDVDMKSNDVDMKSNTNPNNAGIIVVEAKYISGFKIINDHEWIDSNGNPIHHGYGPYAQVRSYMNFLKDFIGCKMPSLNGTVPITYIVWFHKMVIDTLSSYQTISDTSGCHTFCSQDLVNPSRKIENLIKYQAINGKRTLTNEEIDTLKKIMNAKADVFDVDNVKQGLEREFKTLLEEQVRILDFLEEQQTACIQGLGGTGKTVVAIKKAQRCAEDGKTLFLCYNSALNKYLKEKYKGYGIDFYDLDAFKCLAGKEVDIERPTYSDISNYVLSDKFKYKHVIIDEAQDFGKDFGNGINSKKIINDIFDSLRIKTEELEGTLFIFFDRYQCVQSSLDLLPDAIIKPDCLLTLHVNCRNTMEISKTSLNPIAKGYGLSIKNNVKRGVSGEKPSLVWLNKDTDFEKALENSMARCLKKGKEKIVILTVNELDRTILSKSSFYSYNLDCGNYIYDGKKYLVSTVRKFKGLEADAIILIDITSKTFKKGSEKNLN